MRKGDLHWPEKYIPEALTGCWLYSGFHNKKGYGVIGTGEHAHRAFYRRLVGQIPKGLYVLHKCDVRACVNPQHLFLGTQLDNMRDASKKGRLKKVPKKICKRGHSIIGENVYWHQGRGRCATCRKITTALWRAAQ